MCVERRLVATRSPQNLQRAFPGEMWTRCTYEQHEPALCRSSSAEERYDTFATLVRRSATFGKSRLFWYFS